MIFLEERIILIKAVDVKENDLLYPSRNKVSSVMQMTRTWNKVSIIIESAQTPDILCEPEKEFIVYRLFEKE